MNNEEREQLNREYYNRSLDELSKRELSASESIDRAILFTSLPILGIAFAFFRSSDDGKTTSVECLFYISTFIFLVAILSVICSCWTAIFAKKELQRALRSYFFEKGEKPDTPWDKVTRCLNFIATACYFIGVILMFIFFSINF